MIVFSLRILPPPEQHKSIQRSLSAMLGPTRVTPGCLGARLFTEVDDKRFLVLTEEWQSRAQFDEYLNAERLNLLVTAIDLSREPPTVQVDCVEREEGIAALLRHPAADKKTEQ